MAAPDCRNADTARSAHRFGFRRPGGFKLPASAVVGVGCRAWSDEPPCAGWRLQSESRVAGDRPAALNSATALAVTVNRRADTGDFHRRRRRRRRRRCQLKTKHRGPLSACPCPGHQARESAGHDTVQVKSTSWKECCRARRAAHRPNAACGGRRDTHAAHSPPPIQHPPARPPAYRPPARPPLSSILRDSFPLLSACYLAAARVGR